MHFQNNESKMHGNQINKETKIMKKTKNPPFSWVKIQNPPFLLGQYFVNKKSRIKKYMENS